MPAASPRQPSDPAAPWFVLGVMLFSFAVRSVYMESCSMFVRGGVYIVVKDSMGPFVARLSVSSLVFDYILTGPISVVSAGQYLGHLLDEIAKMLGQSFPFNVNYFCRVLRRGGHRLLLVEEHQGHARIQRQGAAHHADHHRDGGGVVDLVSADHSAARRMSRCRPRRCRAICNSPTNRWAGSREPFFPAIPIIALIIAFGHSLLSMSGFETLAQVYREIAYPEAEESEDHRQHRVLVRGDLHRRDHGVRGDDHQPVRYPEPIFRQPARRSGDAPGGP